MRPLFVCILAFVVCAGPTLAVAKGGHGAGKTSGSSKDPGGMTDSGASKSSGDTKAVNASAAPDKASAAAVKPKRKK